MLFRDIAGNEAVKHQLIRSVQESRISHAQLFSSPEGAGALAMAVAYAQYVSCENKQEDDSCGVCNSCKKYQKLIHPDLHFSYPFIVNKSGGIETAANVLEEWRSMLLQRHYFSLNDWLNHLDVANKQPNIPIAECHAITRTLSLKSFESEYKILIMWLPEFLGTEGNSLLKVIEEPPQKTLFLLVTENRDKMLNTILSRTQLIRLNKLSHQDIFKYFVEKYRCNEGAANRIAYLANGNMSAAYALFSETNGQEDMRTFTDWMRLCYSSNGVGIVKWVDEVAKYGREHQKNFLRLAVNIIRDCLLLNEGVEQLVYLSEEDKSFADKFSKQLSFESSAKLIKLLEEAAYHIERNANPKILFLDLSLKVSSCLRIR